MTSNAKLDFPEPESPVTTARVWRGISTLMFFRLCCRAPRIVIRSIIRPEPFSDEFRHQANFPCYARVSPPVKLVGSAQFEGRRKRRQSRVVVILSGAKDLAAKTCATLFTRARFFVVPMGRIGSPQNDGSSETAVAFKLGDHPSLCHAEQGGTLSRS